MSLAQVPTRSYICNWVCWIKVTFNEPKAYHLYQQSSVAWQFEVSRLRLRCSVVLMCKLPPPPPPPPPQKKKCICVCACAFFVMVQCCSCYGPMLQLLWSNAEDVIVQCCSCYGPMLHLLWSNAATVMVQRLALRMNSLNVVVSSLM